MLKKITVIALAYFGVTVGAGFASGQEMLQYYVSYGWWGIAGGAVVLLLMPITAMAILQYGSYFRAQSHGKVFNSITSALVAKFLDYSLSAAQFCIGFVMLAGAGSNLNQQFGLDLWVGSALMVVLVIICGMLNVDKVTNVISSITPVMIALLVTAGVFAILDAQGSLQAVHGYAIANVSSPLPNWILSTLNYIGLSMFSGIAMAIIIGGSNWNPRAAGWGGFVGGAIFGVILILMTVGLLLKVDEVADADLPTLALINDLNPYLGVFASIATYLMIFSTSLGVFYSLGKRLAVAKPSTYKPVFILVTLVGFGLSFFDFTVLVATVFPILGWLGIIFITVLLGTWLANGRTEISVESRRRDKIRALLLRQLNPRRRWTRRHASELADAYQDSNLKREQLSEFMSEDLFQDLEEFTGVEIPEEQRTELGKQLAANYEPRQEGETRVVIDTPPTNR